MTATLKFNLDDQDDSMAFSRATKSMDLCLVLWDFQQTLRSKLKYPDENMPDIVYAELEWVQEQLFEKMTERGINLDDLIQ